MAYRNVKISDLTGEEGGEDDFVSLVVRTHPAISEPVVLDVKPGEIKGLKSAGDLVELELKNGDTTRLVVTVAEFAKLNANISEVLANARGLRGRAPGFRPTQQKD